MDPLVTTVLLAEDNDGHARLIINHLRRAGVVNPIERFRDGAELLTYLGSDRLDSGAYVLLLDIKMPRVDGVEVLRRIKESERLRRIPVVMITTTGDPDEVARCHDLGCSSYITKPTDPGRFQEAMEVLGEFLLVSEVPELDRPVH